MPFLTANPDQSVMAINSLALMEVIVNKFGVWKGGPIFCIVGSPRPKSPFPAFPYVAIHVIKLSASVEPWINLCNQHEQRSLQNGP